MVDDIDNACKVFAHVCFYIVWLCEKLRNTVIQVGSDHFIDPSLFIVFIEFGKSICEKTISGAYKYTLCMTLLDLFCHIQHTLARGNHIIDDNYILSFHRITKKFVGYDRILAVYDHRIVPALIEHTHVNAQNIGEIYGS